MKKFLSTFLVSLFIFYGLNGFAMNGNGISVAVVGAGPSGIVAAADLKEKGYNVTVFEAGPTVGGKVKSVEYEDNTYEIGAVITAPDYKIIHAIAEEVGAELEYIPDSVTSDINGTIGSMSDWASEKYGWYKALKMTKDFAKFAVYVKTHEDFFQPGFANTPPELNVSFEQFMKNYHMEAVLESFRPAMVGCGYGFAEKMPAAYWLKLMRTFGYEYPMHMLFSPGFYQRFKNGWQKMWQDFAEKRELTIHYNSEVIEINRDTAKKVVVKTRRETYEFDKVIITVPHLASGFMRLTADEQAAFSSIRTIPYKVTLAKINHLPRKKHIWLRKNSYALSDGQTNEGKPVLISGNQDTNVYQIYQFADNVGILHDLKPIMEKSLADMGASLVEIISEDLFSYAPHHTIEAFQQGIPQRLENLQNTMNVYYTGGLFNFETVELAAQHGRYLVKEYF